MPNLARKPGQDDWINWIAFADGFYSDLIMLCRDLGHIPFTATVDDDG